MLTKEENRLITLTGPGTPGGALMRCYWHPIALADELPPDGAPLPVKILGEELVLFRDDRDRLGLLGLYCSHRCADLSYGRIEDGGLRCLFMAGFTTSTGAAWSSRPSRRGAGTRTRFDTRPIRSPSVAG
jgi:nitrite reductase/ring-hydroxylating ferredoxin subunit